MEKEKRKISLVTYIISLMFLLLIIVILVCMIIKKDLNEKTTENLDNLNSVEGSKIDNSVTENIIENIVENKVEDKTTNETTNTSIKDEDYIVLYKGEEIQKNVGKQVLTYCMKNTKQNKQKYSIKYYNYEKGKAKGEKTGVFGKEDLYDGYSYVDNVSKIAISKDYNAIPRKYKKIKELPKELEEMMDCTNVDIESIDLDGDGKQEKIVCTHQITRKEDYDVEESEAGSDIMLLDSKYKKIATLASWTIKGEEEFSEDAFLQIDDVTYIDIDNDGVMEILVELPCYKSSELSILKYNNNRLEGEKDIKVDITP